jgi:hypothetical protein
MHREGFFKITKYGQLVVVPLWYLAMQRRLPLMAPGRRRRWTRVILAASLVVTAAYTVADWTGWGAPHGWRVPARADTLIWREAPRVAASLCDGRGRAGGATIVVLGLDERRPTGVGLPWMGVEAARWESEMGALPHVLRQAGCRTITRYPATDLPLPSVLRGSGGEPDLLCAVAPLDEAGGPMVPSAGARDPTGPTGRAAGAGVQSGRAVLPTHILMTYLATSHREEVSRVLAATPECPWRVERELTNAVLLGRAAPPSARAAPSPATAPSPPAAAAGAGSQPATQPGDGVRQGGE